MPLLQMIWGLGQRQYANTLHWDSPVLHTVALVSSLQRLDFGHYYYVDRCRDGSAKITDMQNAIKGRGTIHITPYPYKGLHVLLLLHAILCLFAAPCGTCFTVLLSVATCVYLCVLCACKSREMNNCQSVCDLSLSS